MGCQGEMANDWKRVARRFARLMGNVSRGFKGQKNGKAK